MRALALPAPALLAAALLAVLARLLDHGPAAGLPPGALEAVGRAYFALLILAPLLVYPLAWRRGAAPWARVGLSLLPGFLFWLTELGVRLRWHTLAESLWLVCSPLNLLHLWLSLFAVAVAHLGCRLLERLRGGAPLRPSRRAVLLAVGLVLALPLVAVSVMPFLAGYRALFQSDLLPLPASLPGAIAPGEVATARPAEELPNVVFILSDDHRWDFAGYAGHPFVQTPALDRLAAEGVRFERALVSSSLCSPSRASFLTGTHPHRHGVWNNFTPWSDENRTFLEYLKAAGYRTAFIGKWHMPGNLPQLRGVDHFVTFTHLGGQGSYEHCPLVVDGREEPSRTRYIATELTDRALAWLEANRGGPFALYLSHKNVHAGFLPDEPERGMHADTPVELPPGSHPWTHLTNAQYTHLNLAPLDDSIRKYAEAITSLDREIGRVLEALDRHGLARNTIVIYTSDNGYQWGEHQLVDKRWAYEESIRVPFLLRYPASGHPPAGRIGRLVMNVDVAPTLLAAAGLEVPARMQGLSLLPLLRDPAAPWRDAALYTYYFEPPYPTPTIHAVRTERHKYVESVGLPPALFDLAADPREQRNLAEDPSSAALRSRLEARLRALRAEVER